MSAHQISDPTTEIFLDYISERLVGIARRLLRQHLASEPSETVSLGGPLREDVASVRAMRNGILTAAQTLVKKQDRWRFLFLLRKFPALAATQVFPIEFSALDRMAIFERGVLLSTNLVLAHSPVRTVAAESRERYFWRYDEPDFHNAIELAVLCQIHAYTQFRLNTLVREPLASPVSATTLIDVYNQRLHLQKRLKKSENESNKLRPGIVVPALVRSDSGRPQHQLLSVTGQDGVPVTVVMRNFLPSLVSSERLWREAKHLDTADFERHFHIDFETWWNLWLTVNGMLCHTLPSLYIQKRNVARLAPEKLQADMEKLDDFCETAIGGTLLPDFTVSILQSYRNMHGRSVTEENVHRFVAGLTAPEAVPQPSFTEKPFVFYRLGPDALLWDYLRHAGLTQAITRYILSQAECGATRNKIGSEFEAHVRRVVSQIPGIQVLNWNGVVKDSEGKRVWQVDLVVILHAVAILIEDKNWLKSIRFDEGETQIIGAHQEEAERVLTRYDEMLQLHGTVLLASLRKHTRVPLRGALCVACLREPELIRWADPAWWLEPLKTPRVCTPEELYSYLSNCSDENLISHSKFVDWT